MCLLEANEKVLRVLSKRWIKQTLSASAFRSSKQDFNTTSKLIEAGESWSSENTIQILNEIQNFHTELLESILTHCDEQVRSSLIVYAKSLFERYKEHSQSWSFENCTEVSDYAVEVWERTFSLLSIGEVIAAKILVKYLELHGIPALYIDTPSFSLSWNNLSEEVEHFLWEKFQRAFKINPKTIPIIPWYIWGIPWWILAKLGRGYTDYTWSRSAVALYDSWNFDAVLLYIQKMFGFKSTDPRVLWEWASQAASLTKLSYWLVQRAISKRWAGAWLLNPYSLDERIRSRNTGILVGNPTDDSDVAFIDAYWDPESRWVQLVLWRDYDPSFDYRVYGRELRESAQSHIVYLMGEQLWNTWEILEKSLSILNNTWISPKAGRLEIDPYKEISLVFHNKQEAQQAQIALHQEFIE